jgi:hypothetical protein
MGCHCEAALCAGVTPLEEPFREDQWVSSPVRGDFSTAYLFGSKAAACPARPIGGVLASDGSDRDRVPRRGVMIRLRTRHLRQAWANAARIM